MRKLFDYNGLPYLQFEPGERASIASALANTVVTDIRTPDGALVGYEITDRRTAIMTQDQMDAQLGAVARQLDKAGVKLAHLKFRAQVLSRAYQRIADMLRTSVDTAAKAISSDIELGSALSTDLRALSLETELAQHEVSTLGITYRKLGGSSVGV